MILLLVLLLCFCFRLRRYIKHSRQCLTTLPNTSDLIKMCHILNSLLGVWRSRWNTVSCVWYITSLMDTVTMDAVWFYSLKNLSQIISRAYFFYKAWFCALNFGRLLVILSRFFNHLVSWNIPLNLSLKHLNAFTHHMT